MEVPMEVSAEFLTDGVEVMLEASAEEVEAPLEASTAGIGAA